VLTPVDIHNKEFKRSFRGYNEDEIDEFLDRIVNDYEKLYRENNQLKEKSELTQKDLDQYHQLEKNLQDTLLVAQRTAEEVMTNAKKNAEEIKFNTQQECDNLLKRAELEGKEKIAAATQQVREVIAEYENIAKQKKIFLTKMRMLLHTELELLENGESPDALEAEHEEE